MRHDMKMRIQCIHIRIHTHTTRYPRIYTCTLHIPMYKHTTF